ncbi:CTP:molybdopterin cytidylyltransferase [Enhygromyxa salina]|uniref:CTP:molybdopterin cytidylyltransferase n=1 Tax=Enhygromyxa salina TaxID=215803 RepID=A0A0C1ZRT9_9BACT|nr:nucleotidyltransferase family protein [Enhygromyxa salina]KIG13788.1 CTP:molybdopterin cytidylyltransferase [Enhygromyxa salina]
MSLGRRRVAGLILAGGASQRMGRAKALLEFEGRPFVGIGVELLRQAGCAWVLVVDGAHPLDPHAGAIAGAELVHNHRWQLGPLSSLQCGLARALELEPLLDAVLVHHVERPRVRPQTVSALLASAAAEPDCVWQPSHAGRSGHPLLWPRALFQALASLDPRHETARTLIRGAASGQRRKLEVDDEGVLDNIDTPDQLARLSSPATDL